MSTEDHRPLGHVRKIADGPGNGGCNGADKDVTVLYVRQFMRHYAFQFILSEDVHDPGRHRNGGMLRIPPGGERVGLRLIDDINPRHREFRSGGEPPDHPEQFGSLCLGNLLGPVHLQYQLVAEPVAEQVHAQCHYQCNGHAAFTAEDPSCQYQDGRKPCHE